MLGKDYSRSGYDNKYRVLKPKLLLDTTSHAEDSGMRDIRNKHIALTDMLIEEKRIENREDILREWLIPFFSHVKNEMVKKHRFTDECTSTTLLFLVAKIH
jgi:hypothetical protein